MLVVFAAVVLLALFVNRQKENTDTEATPTKGITFVFGKGEAPLSSIEVKPSEGEAVKLARDAKNTWAFELPAKAEADQGLVESAASQVSALQVVDTLSADANPSTFGFDAPAYVITVKFGEGKARILQVGDATPSGNGYYVRVDKGRIMIADLSGISALTQLADFPPYLYTPTPEPTATEIPPTATATPVVPTETASASAVTPEATSAASPTPTP